VTGMGAGMMGDGDGADDDPRLNCLLKVRRETTPGKTMTMTMIMRMVIIMIMMNMLMKMLTSPTVSFCRRPPTR
jgi:hypothetical protein